MKKILSLFFILAIQSSCQVFAITPQKTVNLHTGSVYILSVDARPKDIQVTNSNILEVTSTSDSFTPRGQLVLTTLQEGISYVTYKYGKTNLEYTIKFLIDNNQPVDKSVIELDTIKDIKKDK